jgi:NAD(P)-dependent dehydrogenase (short-subunit alcohol dehydrogenase family)
MARSILVTGASSGIGEALALEFARRGYAVAVAARRIERLQSLCDRLQAGGAARALPLPLDVTDFDAIPAALDAVRTGLGRLDVLVVNAGVGYSLPAGRGKFDRIRETIDTDLTGAIATIEHALPILRAQGGGHIVGITSIAAWRGLPFMGAYSAAKAGLHRYLQSVRAETRHDSIRVTELAPGYIDTDMNRSVARRPFVIPVEKGAAIMARMIESRAGYRLVPLLPWTLIAPLLSVLPTALVAPAPRRDAAPAGKP